MHNQSNLLCLRFRLEWHIPENVVDQMNNILVQNWHLLNDSPLYRISEMNGAGSQRYAHQYELNRYLHIDLRIEQCIQGLFTGGMPYWHVKCFHKKRTHCLIQDQEQKIPVAKMCHVTS
jgi:hypothetical protein